jgi:toxin ParE1/3/4
VSRRSSTPRFRVRWAEAASADLDEIIAYVAVDAPTNAERLLARLVAKAEGLETTPRRVVPELARFGMRQWRELIIRPYRMIFRVEGSEVYVLALLDGRRDLTDVLLERLLRS